MKRKCLCRLSAVTLMLAAAFFCKGIDKTVKITESKPILVLDTSFKYDTENCIKLMQSNERITFNSNDSYLLGKIAMAEAEGEDTEGKALVILVVLNRVESNKFPDSIEEVIFQEHQFSPISNGRFEKVQPDEDCYKAVELVKNGWNESKGALYFESPSNSEWHKNNLEFLFRHGNHYFYEERD